MNSRRTTQLDISKKTGFDRSTVSLALRNHPSVAPSTKEKILSAAQELGYSPDPMLSALASYRNSQRTKPFQGTLAWLTNDIPPFDWRAVTMFQDYFKGAQSRAAYHGYKIEIFSLTKYKNAERLAHVLFSQNIRGLLVCPQSHSNASLEFPWERFSSVTFGYTLARPQLHVVATTHFRNVTTTIKRLRELGYQKIGFCYSPLVDERVSHYFISAYMMDSHFNVSSRIPPYDEMNPDVPSFKKWYSAHKPDAILLWNPDLLPVIRKFGLKIPEDIGVASYISSRPDKNLSGIYEDSIHSGETAVDLLTSMILHGERGVPQKPHYTQIPGIWIQGATLKYRR